MKGSSRAGTDGWPGGAWEAGKPALGLHWGLRPGQELWLRGRRTSGMLCLGLRGATRPAASCRPCEGVVGGKLCRGLASVPRLGRACWLGESCTAGTPSLAAQEGRRISAGTEPVSGTPLAERSCSGTGDSAACTRWRLGRCCGAWAVAAALQG